MLHRLSAAIRWRVERLGRTVRDTGLRPHRRATRMGLALELDLRDNTQRTLYRIGCYEPRLGELILGSLRPGDVYVDIGAHIGIHALPAARRLQKLGGQVYAFEPSDSADVLEQAARRNGITNLTLVRAAVGADDGTLTLRADPAFGADDPAVRTAFGSGPAVGEFPVIRFDGWAHHLERIDVVKIDVEGGEVDVLRGMRDTLRSLRPRLLVVEENQQALERAGRSVSELRDELGLAGYEEAGRTVDHETVVNAVYHCIEDNLRGALGHADAPRL